ncbi:MAG TPA: glycoside hydrolase family 36 protein [Bacillota bacterium]
MEVSCGDLRLRLDEAAGRAALWRGARPVIEGGRYGVSVAGRGAVWAGGDGLRSAGLELRATAAAAGPGMALRLEVANRGPTAVRVEGFTVLDAARVLPERPSSSLLVYQNGWQSWSAALVKPLTARDPDPLLPLVKVMGTNPARRGTWRRGHIGSDFFSAIGVEGDGLVLGFLTMRDQFSEVVFESRAGRAAGASAGAGPGGPRAAAMARSWADGYELAPGGTLASETLFIWAGDPAEGLELYAAEAGRAMKAITWDHVPTGWCTWYHYFTKVTEGDVLDNLEHLGRLRGSIPLEYVQIDDGYQHAIGDWLEINEKFPHGMKWLAEKIKEAGFKPGLWLAPFTVMERSNLWKAHPDWILRDGRGRPVYGGNNLGWGGRIYGLDCTHPGVIEWLKRVFRTVTDEWGYDYVKIDFLYCAALAGRHHDRSATRAQALRRGLEAIREAVGDARFILGCGLPLGPAVGLVNGMRIGEDVAPQWGPTPLPWEKTIPGTVNAIRNTLTRAFLHDRWWLNDPDCLLLRDRRTKLTPVEVESLATVIALSGGLLLTSDDFSAVSPQRLEMLLEIFPPSRRAARAVDLFKTDAAGRPSPGGLPSLFVRRDGRDGEGSEAGGGGERWSVGIFNWSGRPVDLSVDLTAVTGRAGPWHVHDIWAERDVGLVEGVLSLPSVPAHGCRYLALSE